MMRRHGFKGGTVPGVKLDGERVQGTLEISRALDAAQPSRRSSLRSRHARRGEVAELWGEQTWQPVPRRIFRWAVSSDSTADDDGEVDRRAGPGVTQWGLWPLAQFYLRYEGGGEKAARRRRRRTAGASRPDRLLHRGRDDRQHGAERRGLPDRNVDASDHELRAASPDSSRAGRRASTRCASCRTSAARCR